MSETKPTGAALPLKAPTDANGPVAVGDGVRDGSSDGARDGTRDGTGDEAPDWAGVFVGASVAAGVGAGVPGLAELGDDEQALKSTTAVSPNVDALLPLIRTGWRRAPPPRVTKPIRSWPGSADLATGRSP